MGRWCHHNVNKHTLSIHWLCDVTSLDHSLLMWEKEGREE